MSEARFRPYEPDQLLLLPPDLREWLPEDDLVYFLMDVTEQLDLSKIYKAYDGSQGGQPAYDPKLMVRLLLYAYCVGLPSSRKIEQATYYSVPFRVLCADNHPDHDTISEFGSRHLEALAGLFVNVLRLCQKAGLVKLGHVALDSTKVKANASKHKSMTYGRMQKKVDQLQDEVKQLLAKASATDADEDARYGKGKRCDELPRELRFKQSRLQKIREAMQALEDEARAEHPAKEAEYKAKQKAHRNRKGRGRRPKSPSSKPEPDKQRNFTDPDSRLMKSGKEFVQGYNCQAAVDGTAQVIVATDLTQDANDKHQALAMVQRIKANTRGARPKKLTADSGYFEETRVRKIQRQGIDTYIAASKWKHSEPPPPAPRGRIPNDATTKDRMIRKLRTLKGRGIYSKRKEVVEPVFGQIKAVRGLDRFSFRGMDKVAAEWDLVCLTHNLLKLFRSGWQPQTT